MKSKLIQTKVFLPPDLVRELEQRSKRLNLHKSELARQAIASFLAADAPDRLESALAKRLDRLSRGQERIERDLQIANEAQALFIRAWLAATPSAPDGAARAAMETKGRERYVGFVAALGRRVASGRTLLQEILDERGGDTGS